MLEALDQHQIARRKLGQRLAEFQFRPPPQLVHDRPAVGRCHQNFAATGVPMAVGILARIIDFELMVGVLDQ